MQDAGAPPGFPSPVYWVLPLGPDLCVVAQAPTRGFSGSARVLGRGLAGSRFLPVKKQRGARDGSFSSFSISALSFFLNTIQFNSQA